MAKIEIAKTIEIMKKNGAPAELVRVCVEEMNLLAKPESEEEKTPRVKQQFTVLVSDPNGIMPTDDLVCWVLQLPEDESVATTRDKIHKAVYEYNVTRKGRLHPAQTVGEALEFIPAKHFKEAGLTVKTKTPVLVLKTDNKIPKDEANHVDRRTSGNQAVSFSART